MGPTISGTLSLQINKKADNTFYPVATHVEESVGTTFSLVCELVSTANETQFDDQLSWVRQDQLSGRQDQSDDIKEINKSEKRFQPLAKEDKGKYLCVSNKFNLNKAVTVVVRSEVPKERKTLTRISKTSFCNPHMFPVSFCRLLRQALVKTRDFSAGLMACASSSITFVMG